jgi:aminoglycoside phosphotransferase (APT) family kinase protein
MTLEDCLPTHLRRPDLSITRIAAGLSGAGVYRVESQGEVFVLKVAGDHENADEWPRTLRIQRLATEVGLAPPIVHVEEARRAVLTVFVADQSFPTFYHDPRTHQAAVALLGRTVGRVHALPVPEDAPKRDPAAFLAKLQAGLAGFALPAFAPQAVERALASALPSGRPAVLSHNDLNPSNLIYDGAGVQLLDWSAAGPLDPLYDLATLAVFLRMEAADCRALLAAHDGEAGAALPAAFVHMRRLVAALTGTMQLILARRMNHPGSDASKEGFLSLGEFYQAMRTGALRLGTPEGQWAFGLALLKESLSV